MMDRDLQARVESVLRMWDKISNESRRRSLALQLGPETWPLLLAKTKEPWLADLIAEHEMASLPPVVSGVLCPTWPGPLLSEGEDVWARWLALGLERRRLRMATEEKLAFQAQRAANSKLIAEKLAALKRKPADYSGCSLGCAAIIMLVLVALIESWCHY